MSADNGPVPSTSRTRAPASVGLHDESPPPNPGTAPGGRGARTERRGERRADAEPPDESPAGGPAAAPADRGARLARLGDRIAELSARIQAATYELLVLIREFDEQEGWDGCLTCAHWLSWRAGLSPGAAREHVRVARALGELPRLSDAMRRGKVSYSKVRAVTRVATPENEQSLLDVALAGTAAHVERIARAWRRIDRNVEQAEERRQQASRGLRTWVDEDGMVVVRGRLMPEVGAVLRRALEAACDRARRAPAPDGVGEKEAAAAPAGPEKEVAAAPAGGEKEAAAAPAGPEKEAAAAPAGGDREAAAESSSAPAGVEEPTLAQRQADAIGTVAEAALAGGLDRGTAGDRYQVVLHVDAEALAERPDVPAGTSGGAACESEARTGADRVPAGTSGGMASGPEARAGGDRVPAGTSGDAGSGPEARAGGDRVPAGTSGGMASGPEARADGDRVPAGTSGGVASGPEARADGDRVPAGTSGDAGSGPEARAGGDRVPAGTPAATHAAAGGPGDGSPMHTPSRAGRARHSRRHRTAGPCPGVWPTTPASDTAASEPSGAHARRSGPARGGRRPPTSTSTPSAAKAAGRQTALDEAGGIHVSAETARRMACDAATVTMRHGPGGEILDVGRRTRTISPALRRALAARDRQCRFPGCGNARCDVHHLEHWADGGRTALDNLVLLCRRHHRAVHEEGFRVTVDADGGVQFVGPDGRPLPEAPPAPAWAGPALQPTNDGLSAAGIEIGADTGTPSWRGERLDLDYAMSVLWRPRREPPAE